MTTSRRRARELARTPVPWPRRAQIGSGSVKIDGVSGTFKKRKRKKGGRR